MKKTFLALSVLALSVGLPAVAQFPEIPPGKWWKRPAVIEQLKLSGEQQERLEEIFSKNRRSFIDLKADVERRQLDVEDLMVKKDSDPKRVSTAIDALEQAKSRLRKTHTMMILEMKGILTAEQWQTILDRTEDWKRLRQERQGEGLGRRMGRLERERERANPPSQGPSREPKE